MWHTFSEKLDTLSIVDCLDSGDRDCSGYWKAANEYVRPRRFLLKDK
jgi:hypothetical protein